MKKLVLLTALSLGLVLASCEKIPHESLNSSDEGSEMLLEGNPIRPSTAEPVQPCPDPQPVFITGTQVRQEQPIPEPEAGLPFRDEVYGACVVRVTDRQRDLPADDPSGGIKNEYSRVQSFNADNTLIMARSIEAEYYIYDALALEMLGRLPAMTEPRWSNIHPELIYFMDELAFKSYNLSDGIVRLVHDFTADFSGRDLAAVWTRWEGAQSLDDRYWAWMAEDQDWMTVSFIVYDLQADQIIARRDLRPPEDVDSVTISPLGGYFLAQFEACGQGVMGSAEHPCGLMAYGRDLENPRGLLRVVGHSDTALDEWGREVFLYQDIDTDHIALLDLESGEIADLFPIDFTCCSACGMHFSGLAFQAPGWGLVSYCDGDPRTRMWMDDHIFALELKPSGRVIRLAQHHSLVDPRREHDYWAEPHASVNRDFTRVLFTSNWGRSGTDEVDIYMLYLPESWMESESGQS